ncbi:MAG: precorrin-8X methylmutase, partial [Mangrovicoccus sp.]
MDLVYERDPKQIYAQSFATISSEADLSRFGPEEAALATRLIHACGMVEIAEDLVLSPGVVAAGRAAVAAGAPIFCDAEMVARGIIARALPEGCAPVVTLNEAGTPDRAAQLGTTRSAAAVEAWVPRLGGSVVAIGNAPTALFHLLEGLARGWPKPAVILGFPVGFVGAAESKEALIAAQPCPIASLPGRRGGSAMAAAAVNALLLGLAGDGR